MLSRNRPTSKRMNHILLSFLRADGVILVHYASFLTTPRLHVPPVGADMLPKERCLFGVRFEVTARDMQCTRQSSVAMLCSCLLQNLLHRVNLNRVELPNGRLAAFRFALQNLGRYHFRLDLDVLAVTEAP